MSLRYSCPTSVRYKRGFTIVELMVVLLIISVLSFSIYQVISGLWKNQFISVSRFDLNNYITLAREKASSSQFTHVLIIMREEKKMGLKKLPKGLDHRALDLSITAGSEEKYLLEGDWVMEPVALPSDFEDIFSVSGQKLEGPYNYLMFYPDGSSDPLLWKMKDGGLYVSSQSNLDITLDQDFFDKFSLQ